MSAAGRAVGQDLVTDTPYAAWSPDGSRLAYGNAEGGVSFFDATQLPGYMPMAEATVKAGE